MDLLTVVLHEMGHVLGYDDQSAQRRHATLMTETLPTGVRRSLMTDAFSSVSSDHAPLTMHHSSLVPRLTPPVESAKDVGGRSLQAVAGFWGRNGNDHGSAPPPVIDWTTGDSDREQKKQSLVGASPQKASWLQRFLFQLGRDEAKPHDHGIEVVLPGKKQ
jgi:hypothetical protein